MSSISTTDTLNIREDSGNIEYYFSGSWITISSWPVTIINTDTSQTLKVLFTTDITLTANNQCFICGSSNIQFGDTSLQLDGTRPIITISAGATNFPGLVQNGTLSSNGYNNILILNLIVDGTAAELDTFAGWLTHSQFSRNATGNKVINCSSKGNITNQGGGIIGSFSAIIGNLTVICCNSEGSLLDNNCGGIIGTGTDNTTAIQCFSKGNIVGVGGGIFAPVCQNCTAIKCYSIGNINGGGIFGSNATSCISDKCYSLGSISNNSGGIFDFNVSLCYAINCYSTGTINATGGGIFNIDGLIDSFATNCYTSGTSTGVGGIYSGSSNDNLYGSNNYSESNNSGSGWSDTNALTHLQGVGTTTWLSVLPNTAYQLLVFGTSPYTLNNINSSTYDLVQSYSQTVSAGGATISHVVAGYKLNSFQLFNAPPTITIDSTTGVISTTSSTLPGTYTLIIYAVDDYTTTEFELTVIGSHSSGTLGIVSAEESCCALNTCINNSPTTDKSNEILSITLSGKTIVKNVNSFYAAIKSGSKTYNVTPVFKSYSDYMLYLQGKNR